MRSQQTTEKVGKAYHVTKMAPLVKKVSVYIYTVRLAQVFRYESPYSGEVFRFERVFVSNVF